MPTGAPASDDRTRRELAASFPRERRLKRQRLIRPLFERDRSDVSRVRVGPIDVRFRLVPISDVGVDVPLQVGFAVGRAIGDRPARNRVKRLLRETFRLHQDALTLHRGPDDPVPTMMILYRGRYEGAAPRIRRALPEGLHRVAAEISASKSRPS